jgi:hypothetical protein
LSKTEFLKKRREELLNTVDFKSEKDESYKKTSSGEDLLKVYKHIPKEEDPRFTTSSVSSYFGY